MWFVTGIYYSSHRVSGYALVENTTGQQGQQLGLLADVSVNATSYALRFVLLLDC